MKITFLTKDIIPFGFASKIDRVDKGEVVLASYHFREFADESAGEKYADEHMGDPTIPIYVPRRNRFLWCRIELLEEV